MLEKEAFFTPCYYNISMRVAYAIQMVMKAYNACKEADEFECTQIAMQPYVLQDKGKVMLEIVGSRKQRYALLQPNPCYTVDDCAVALGDPGNSVEMTKYVAHSETDG